MTENEPTDVLEMDPVDVQETDEAPSGTPPENWDQEVHADEYAADPDVSTDEES